jgi:glycosyltransferase involved in cell wall biosynthesis
MAKLSVVISAWNEETKIGRCLESVSWADELIVIDNASTDKTAQIAAKFRAKVYRQPNHEMLNLNKNYGFSKATGDWILNLDADEEVTPELKKEIQKVLETGSATGKDVKVAFYGYWIKRKNISFGKWITHGLWWPDKQLRLFQRGRGEFPCKHIHEYISVKGAAGELTAPYLHHNYETVSQYLTKLDRCTTSEAGYLLSASYQLSWFDAIRFPVSDFIKIYFAQRGYRDGLHGLVLALLQAFYAFIVFAKTWEKAGFWERDIPLRTVAAEIVQTNNSFDYWILGCLSDETRPPFNWYFRLIRKIKFILSRNIRKAA